MTAESINERILHQRYHGLYLSRQCGDIAELARELLGLHCWFHRNVAFSALIRGADISGWKHALTKTWLYRGTLHGVDHGDLPRLLALQKGESWLERAFGEKKIDRFAGEVIRCMEDGVYSRAEMRKIFAEHYDRKTIEHMFSPWGGIFVYLAGQGKVAFRDMTSRDFDLIDAESELSQADVLPDIFHQYIKTYGPATLEDAAYFLGFWRDGNKVLRSLPLGGYERIETGKKVYYHCGEPDGMGGIPEVILLSGFDPLIVSYTERSAVLPAEYKKRVILSSGICLPTIAVNGKVAGLWNIKKGEAVVEFFDEQPRRITDKAFAFADGIRRSVAGRI
jgi:hypothetical protein